MDVSDTLSTLTYSGADELAGHNIWNFVLEQLFHVQVGAFMEALFDEVELGRIALSCHFALDVLCNTAEVHCLVARSVSPLTSVKV